MGAQGTKGGGTVQPVIGTAPATPPATPAQAPAPTPNPAFNVNQAAATGLQGAMAGTQQAMGGPLNVGAYMNPYTQEVIDRTQNDIERQRLMALNNVGAQAERANAFGGSRQALVEGTTNAEYGRMAGDMAAQQRMAGYNTAMANAMADRTGRLGAASQLGSLANQAFNTGRTINQDMLQQGLLQQSLQQALLDSAATDMSNYANAPMNSLSAPLAALGAANMNQQTQTTTQNPGILGTLGALKYIGMF